VFGDHPRASFVATRKAVIFTIKPNKKEEVAAQLPIGFAQELQKGWE
jgi:hypothetical protein